MILVQPTETRTLIRADAVMGACGFPLAVALSNRAFRQSFVFNLRYASRLRWLGGGLKGAKINTVNVCEWTQRAKVRRMRAKFFRVV